MTSLSAQEWAAQALYEESLAELRELGERKNTAVVLDNLGKVYQERGDLCSESDGAASRQGE